MKIKNNSNSEYLSISTIEELHVCQKFLRKEIEIKENKLKFDVYCVKEVLNPLNIIERILNDVAIKGFEIAKDAVLRAKSSFDKSGDIE